MNYWDEAARQAVEEIFASTPTVSALNIERKVSGLRSDIDAFIEESFPTPDTGGDTTSVRWWTTLGADAIEISRLRQHGLDVDTVVSTLIRKQRDYGHENIRRFGRQGLMVRCHDKVARLENLTGSTATPNNESIDDTLLDVVGYSAIGIMWERSLFLLPLAPAA